MNENSDEWNWKAYVCMAAVVIGIGAMFYWIAVGPSRGH